MPSAATFRWPRPSSGFVPSTTASSPPGLIQPSVEPHCTARRALDSGACELSCIMQSVFLAAEHASAECVPPSCPLGSPCANTLMPKTEIQVGRRYYRGIVFPGRAWYVRIVILRIRGDRSQNSLTGCYTKATQRHRAGERCRTRARTRPRCTPRLEGTRWEVARRSSGAL